MKRSTAAALLSLFLAPAPVLAADLGAGAFSVPRSAAAGESVEIGTNWYIRGDIGAGFDSLPTLTFPTLATSLPGSNPVNNPAGSTSKFNTNFLAGIGIGFKYNDYLRFEASYDYRAGSGLGVTTTGIVCPSGAAVPTGYIYDPTVTCNSNLKLKQHDNVLLANAYVDLGDYFGLTPYVGAGAGLNVNSLSGSATYTTAATGASYPGTAPAVGVPGTWVNKTGAVLTPQPGAPFFGPAWDNKINATKYNLAFALMAGVGYALSSTATLDVNYRYMNLGTTSLTLKNPTGAVIKTSASSQDVRVGIRYLLN